MGGYVVMIASNRLRVGRASSWTFSQWVAVPDRMDFRVGEGAAALSQKRFRGSDGLLMSSSGCTLRRSAISLPTRQFGRRRRQGNTQESHAGKLKAAAAPKESERGVWDGGDRCRVVCLRAQGRRSCPTDEALCRAASSVGAMV